MSNPDPITEDLNKGLYFGTCAKPIIWQINYSQYSCLLHRWVNCAIRPKNVIQKRTTSIENHRLKCQYLLWSVVVIEKGSGYYSVIYTFPKRLLKQDNAYTGL